MTDAERKGIELAEQLILWFIYYGPPEVKASELKAAIRTVFGDTIADELQTRANEGRLFYDR